MCVYLLKHIYIKTEIGCSAPCTESLPPYFSIRIRPSPRIHTTPLFNEHGNDFFYRAAEPDSLIAFFCTFIAPAIDVLLV